MTVADLERRLTMRELVEWLAFEDEFGPLTVHQRVDALIAATIGERPRWVRPRPLAGGEVGPWLRAIAGRRN